VLYLRPSALYLVLRPQSRVVLEAKCLVLGVEAPESCCS